MNDITVRFLEVYSWLKKNKLVHTPKGFANEIDVSTSLITEICKKRTNAGITPIQNLINRFPEINSNWLLTGVGEMVNSESQTSFKSYPKPDKKEKKLPLIPIDAIAGFGTGEFTIMEHDVLEYYKIPEFSNADFLIPVKGSSMQPKYYGGDILACKHIQTFSFFQWGVPHVITIKDRGTVVKRIMQSENKNKFDLVSDNSSYPLFTISSEDIVNIAIVIGVIRVEN
jgi:phage repressor protein C with HTH and peptisase S24 domain